VTTTGSFPASATFVDAMGTTWMSVMNNVDVTKLGPVGDTIEGDYYGAFVAPGKPMMFVKGDFQVCHVPDEEVP
jgi:hypothetical protein